jgi:hypothetical protein
MGMIYFGIVDINSQWRSMNRQSPNKHIDQDIKVFPRVVPGRYSIPASGDMGHKETPLPAKISIGCRPMRPDFMGFSRPNVGGRVCSLKAMHLSPQLGKKP